MPPILSWTSGRTVMHPYDAAQFDPPAPLALVTIKSLELDIEIHDVPMLLDTGADVSLLPRARFEKVAAADAKQYELQAFDGTKSVAQAVVVEMLFLNKSLRGQFLLIDGPYGILGRNILN